MKEVIMNKLTEQDYVDAAALLECRVAAIKAVAEVESRGDGFLPNGDVKILYEPHIFSRLTNHKYDSSNPDISYPKWKTGAYGVTSIQWNKLNKAANLDRNAALQSASYGKFQIMGFNYSNAGFTNVNDFVDAMKKGEREHLLAFCNFVISNKLDDDLRNLQWESFAKGYNGAGYKANAYHIKMRDAFLRHLKG
jgi:hypothetical protein